MLGALCVVFLASACLALEEYEPRCSKFAFEERVLEKMVRVEHKMELLTEKMENFEKQVAETMQKSETQTMEKMQNSEQQIAERQTKLETEKANMIQEFEALKKTLVQEQAMQKGRIDQALQAHAATISRMSGDLQDITNKTIQQIEGKMKPSIMYNARKPNTVAKTGSQLVFTTVLVNEGQGYDSSTGVFTTPREGVYIFTAQICTLKKKWVGFGIMANETVIAASSLSDIDSSGSCTSTTAIARLAAGTSVKVLCTYSPGGSVLYQGERYSWNSFSGMLV